jgi:hypothetical protein
MPMTLVQQTKVEYQLPAVGYCFTCGVALSMWSAPSTHNHFSYPIHSEGLFGLTYLFEPPGVEDEFILKPILFVMDDEMDKLLFNHLYSVGTEVTIFEGLIISP